MLEWSDTRGSSSRVLSLGGALTTPPPKIRLMARFSTISAAVAVVAALVVSLVVLVPALASAQSKNAYLSGAEAWTESDCDGEEPIVVGSDAMAQSDIYSAITLAGAIDTACVILAGARDGSMAAVQRARLDAADLKGYVVGGEAAVPTAKFSKPGRQLQRIGGSDRWATAQQVGAIAAGSDPTRIADPPSKSDSKEVQSAGAHISGAEGWLSSDCTAAVPIVVGSDAAAQSDIYSAISLAGVVGTNCVILAGARNGDIPAAQSQRLKAAAPGGFIVGGTASVPDAKVNKPNMARIAGADRWTTAHLVGQRADGYTAISAHGEFACGLRTNGKVTCWGDNSQGQTNVPDGIYTTITASYGHACGLRTNGRITCWGDNSLGQTDVPDGTYTAITASYHNSCGLRTNGKVACWGDNSLGQTDVPDGTYTAITAGEWHACALGTNGKVACWGSAGGDLPDGTYTAITAGEWHTCALGINGKVVCWGAGDTDVPDGTYTAIAAALQRTCGLRTNGKVACWGSGDTDGPDGTYTAITVGPYNTCALRTNGKIVCWGLNEYGESDEPDGVFIAVDVGFHRDAELNEIGGFSCALRVNGQIVCWGGNGHGQTDVP